MIAGFTSEFRQKWNIEGENDLAAFELDDGSDGRGLI